MKRFFWFSGVAILIVAGYLAYPYWCAKRLADAIAMRDLDTIEEIVDFAKVREGIKSDIRSSLASSLKPGPGTGMLAAAAANLSGLFLDDVVTPEGISRFAVSGEMRGAMPDPATARTRLQARVRAMGFASPTTFRIVVGGPDDPPARWSTLTMTLDGLSWRLTRVRIPDPLGNPPARAR